jgi:hypothetical protein
MGRRKFYVNDVVENVNTGMQMTITGYGTIKGNSAYKGKTPAGKTVLIAETSLKIVNRPEKPQ